MNIKRIIGKIQRYFTQHPLLRTAIEWSKNHSLPGLKRIPLFNIVEFVLLEIKNDALVTRANSMAFSFFLAIFPGLIVLFTLLAYTSLYESFNEVMRQWIDEIMPGNAGTMVFKTIEDIITIPRSGLLSFGFVLAIWFASNGMLTMMRGLEKEYDEAFRRRSALEKRMIAIQLTFLMALIIVSSVILVILGNTILDFIFHYLRTGAFTRWLLFAFRWIVIFFLFYAGISSIYRYGSSTKRKIPFFNAGAMLSTLLSIISSWAFSFYVDNFGTYNKVYGSIGTLIVLMIWIQLNCMILLLGFEVNASVAVLRERRRINRQSLLEPLQELGRGMHDHHER